MYILKASTIKADTKTDHEHPFHSRTLGFVFKLQRTNVFQYIAIVMFIFLDIRKVCAWQDPVYTKMAQWTNREQKFSRKDAMSVLSGTKPAM